MRAARSLSCVGVSTARRRKRALVPLIGWVVMSAVLARMAATVVHVAPSRLVWMSKSRVFQRAGSPPAAACRMTNRPTWVLAPRSMRRNLVAPSEHHLSLLPPDTLPLTALAGPSAGAHWLSAVAGLFSARFGFPPRRFSNSVAQKEVRSRYAVSAEVPVRP